MSRECSVCHVRFEHRFRKTCSDLCLRELRRRKATKYPSLPTCQGCGVNYNPKCGNRRTINLFAPELDHVIPLGLGGLHNKDNIRLTHRKFNAAKGMRRPFRSLEVARPPTDRKSVV